MQLQQGHEAVDLPAVDVDDEPARLRGTSPALLCLRCEHPITETELGIEHAGRHRHTCINPAGAVYRIALYRDAPGCEPHAQWFSDYSWFADHEWQVAVCARCDQHLGWRFRGTASFYGLIAARLVAARAA